MIVGIATWEWEGTGINIPFLNTSTVAATNRILGRSSGNHNWLLSNANACV